MRNPTGVSGGRGQRAGPGGQIKPIWSVFYRFYKRARCVLSKMFTVPGSAKNFATDSH
ncbi:MAG: hypothetical protein ACE5IY_17625 [bacterium]